MKFPHPNGLGDIYFSHVIHASGQGPNRLTIFFQPPDVPVKPNGWDAARSVGYLVRPISEYPHYLDLLRNEKPVQTRVWTTPDHHIEVFVTQEPVGEGEIAGMHP
jgi:hypothetical protein